MNRHHFFKIAALSACIHLPATQSNDLPPDSQHTVKATVDFSNTLQEWDGFGVNYVELAQSTDPTANPQDYGGFSRLNEDQREEVIEMIFGESGLKPAIIKMFLDPFHQKEVGGDFDHESTTKWMRNFAQKGVAKSNQGGRDIEIITTLYGPPAWATKQKILRGRDLDPQRYRDLAAYMIDWCQFLIESEGLPLKYLSPHNEGDKPHQWPVDASHGNIGTGRDYNAFWRPWEVASFIEFVPEMIKEAGLSVGFTSGECSNWGNFTSRMYNWAIFDNEKAISNLGLITCHGFGEGLAINSWANDLLRFKRPDLHSWTASITWGNEEMEDYEFINLIRRNIYDAKVNAVIPWACIQTDTWIGGDPNPDTAFFVKSDGSIEIRPQYYYYKQISRVGQQGMRVASVEVEGDSGIELLAFSSNGTIHPNAFVILNSSSNEKNIAIDVQGIRSTKFTLTRSSKSEKYLKIGEHSLSSNGILIYNAPAGSVSTFISE